MTTLESAFAESDDHLHPVSDNYYETETFWYSFFVPERDLGAWIYTSVRRNAGVTQGGMWIWDATGAEPWDVPFYENFSALKLPTSTGRVLSVPTGATIDIVEPGMVYDVAYDNRSRTQVALTYRGLERPVPLRRGAPPYPVASHFDQTCHVTGHLVLDGDHIEVDCYAMRDRSWGRRNERGYARVGYTWLADPQCSLLAYSAPLDAHTLITSSPGATDAVHSGYVRRGDDVVRIVGGSRTVTRDPGQAWVDTIDIAVVDENGVETTVTGHALSRMILPGATSVCVNTLLRFEIDGRVVHGEDQDVWPREEFRRARAPRR